jgi:hypothetical protein
MYTEQIGCAVDEGIDSVISETNDCLGEMLIALEVIRQFGPQATLPLIARVRDTVN